MEIQLQISGTEGLLETGIENVNITNNATGKSENIIKLTPTVSKFFHSISQDAPPSTPVGNITQINMSITLVQWLAFEGRVFWGGQEEMQFFHKITVLFWILVAPLPY